MGPGIIEPAGRKSVDNAEAGIIQGFFDGLDVGQAFGENADIGLLIDRFNVVESQIAAKIVLIEGDKGVIFDSGIGVEGGINRDGVIANGERGETAGETPYEAGKRGGFGRRGGDFARSGTDPLFAFRFVRAGDGVKSAAGLGSDFLQELDIDLGVGEVTGSADADTDNRGEAMRKSAIDGVNHRTFVAGRESDFEGPASLGVAGGGVLKGAAVEGAGGVDAGFGPIGTGNGRVFGLGKFMTVKLIVTA